MIIQGIVIILFNLIIAYIISLYSYIMGVGWFCFAIGFQFGMFYKSYTEKDIKENNEEIE